MEIELGLPKSGFLAGEDLTLQVTVRNTGAAPVRLPDPFHSFNWQPTYTVRGPGHPAGKTFSFRSAVMTSAAPTGDEAKAPMIELAPGASASSGVPLHQWVPLGVAGRYTVSAHLAWKGLDASSQPVAFEIEQPVPAGLQLVVDEQGSRALWLHRGATRSLLVEQHFQEREAMPGVVRTHVQVVVAEAPLAATTPFSPPSHAAAAEMLHFWRGYRDAAGLVALAPEGPVRWPLPEDGLLVQEPFLLPGGELDALSVRGRSLSFARLPPAGGPAPRELWTLSLEEPPLELVSAERIDRRGGRRLAFSSSVQGGVHLSLLELAATQPAPPQHVRAGEALPLPASRPALRLDPEGGARVALVYQRTARRLVGLPLSLVTLLEAQFGPDGAPAGPPVLTDLGEPPGVPVGAVAALPEPGGSIWAVLLADGRVWHSRAPQRPQRLPGAALLPLQLLLRGERAYLLVLPPQGGPVLIALQ